MKSRDEILFKTFIQKKCTTRHLRRSWQLTKRKSQPQILNFRKLGVITSVTLIASGQKSVMDKKNLSHLC